MDLSLVESKSFQENQTVCAFTTSRNSSVSLKTVRQPTYAFLYFIFMVVMMLTVCGNLAVIISVSHFKKLHIPSNFLVLSLAIADFLVGIIVMPLIMVQSIEICWCFSDVFCLIFSFMDVFLMSVSIHNLMLIAIDRYIAVCAPFLYSRKMTIQVTSVLISLNWILSLIYTLFIIYYKENVSGQNSCPEECIFILGEVLLFVDLLVSFIVPSSSMILLYMKIFIVARKHAKIINCRSDHKVAHDMKKKNVSKGSERKAAKTLGIVIVAFLVCWIPFNVCTLSNSNFSYSNPGLFKALSWLVYFNSAMNPVIYALFYTWFQRALKLLVTFRICNPESSLIILLKDY